MTLLGAETVTVQHYTQTRSKGRAVPATSGDSFTAVASIQPVVGEVMHMLPVGARMAAEFLMLVEDDPGIRATDIGSQTPSDRVTRASGEVFRVHTLRDWTPHTTGLPHHAYILKRVADDES